MGKRLILFILLFSLFLSISCFASESFNSILDAVPDSLKDYQLDELNEKDLSNFLSFGNVFEKILKIVTSEFPNCAKLFLKILGVIILFSVFNHFALKNNISANISSGVVSAAVLVISSPTINSNLNLITKTVESSKVFSTATIPVVTMLSISSGKAFGTSVFSAAMSFCSSLFQYITDYFLLPITMIFLVFGLVSGLSMDFDVYSICAMIKKIIKWIITFFVSIFATSLTFQNILSSSSDGVVKKTVQNAVGKFIPVIGSTLSGAIDEMFALATLSKVTVSVLGILVIVFLFLPLITGNMIYGFAFSLCKYILRFFKAGELTNIMNTLSDTFFLFSGIISACAFMLVTSYLFLCIGVT